MIENCPRTGINLVPDTVNTSPDYFCTWQVQLYRCNNAGPQGQRDCMTEADIFGSGDEAADRRLGRGWASHLYKDARRDLIFLMDDCWDVPLGERISHEGHYGSQLLAPDKFPSFAGEGVENRDAMKKLSDKIKSLGWRGLGGWICIERSPLAPAESADAYWAERLKWADYAGWLYWKIDWGADCRVLEERQRIIELRRKLAPNLIAEQAMLPELIPYADSFRTYDVFTLLAIPITLEKLAVDLAYDAAPGYLGYVNCMDEVYTAAALGCAIDVTRHDMRGPLPNGQPDPSFPADIHRNLKTKTDEVTRTVRWHRIAPAFSVNGSETFIDPVKMTDCWDVVDQPREIEAWWKYRKGDHIERSGPARISRSLPPAVAEPDAEGLMPYLVSALHPCGVASVATLARTLGRRFFTPLCRVTQNVKSASMIGVFGYYGELRLETTAAHANSRILMQDLLDGEALDVTALCEAGEGYVVIPGALIAEAGTMGNHPGDTSEPGLIVKID